MPGKSHFQHLTTLIVVIFAAALSAGCVRKVKVESVFLDQTSASLKISETAQLSATISPSDAENQAVAWTSSDAGVATVVDGLVTAVAAGQALITVTTADGGFTATCMVTVSAAEIKVKKVTMNRSDTSLVIGDTIILRALVLPLNATDRSLKWEDTNPDSHYVSFEKESNSDTSVAVKALKLGKTSIRTSSANGYWASCLITVKTAEVHVNYVSVSPGTLSISIDQTSPLTVSVMPSDATDKSVTWSTDDPLVATVDADGNVTGVGKGTATITAKSTDGGLTASCTVTVLGYALVGNISLSKTSLTMDIGKKDTVNITMSPSYAHDKTYSVSVDDAAVVNVTQPKNGMFVARALKAGKVTVTVKANDEGAKTAKCSIEVLKDTVHVTSVVMNVKDTVLNFTRTLCDSLQLSATVYPKDATDPSLIWSATSSMVAYVRQNGMVIAISEGETDVSVYSNDNIACKDVCHVTVRRDTIYVKGLTLSQYPKSSESARLYSGQKVNLTATLSPPNSNYLTGLTWRTKNAEVGVSASSGSDRSATATVVNASNSTSSAEMEAESQNGVKGTAQIFFGRIAVFDQYSEVTDTLECEADSSLAISCKWNESSAKFTSVPDVDLSWKSSDYSIAYVSGGKLNCVKTGTAVITASVGLVQIPVNVKVVDKSYKVKSISVFPLNLYVTVDSTAQIAATVSPSHALNKKVHWSSADVNIAKVDTMGLVCGVSKGVTDVTATTDDGGFTASCHVTVSDSSIHVKSIAITRDSVSFTNGDSYTVYSIITPLNATTKDVAWDVSDSKIIKVTESGYDTYGAPYCVIKGVGVGDAILTVTTEDLGRNSSLKVHVTKKPIRITSVSVSASPSSGETSRLYPGQKVRLTASYEPADANTDTLMTWKSDKPVTVPVSIDAGASSLHATANISNPENRSGMDMITVTSDNGFLATSFIYYGRIAIGIGDEEQSSLTVKANTTTQLQALYESATALLSEMPSGTVTWTSSNPAYATVSSGGVLKAIQTPTSVTITAKAGGASVSLPVSISGKWTSVTGVSLSQTSVKAVKDSVFALVATVSPVDADNQKVIWTSSDTTIATVSDYGIVRVREKFGSATITATTDEGGYAATCIVSVTSDVLKITLVHSSTDSTRSYSGQTVSITPVYYPDYATTGKDLNWSSSNSSYASISKGVATITNKVNLTSSILVTASNLYGLKAYTTIYFGKLHLYYGNTEAEDLKSVKMKVGDTYQLSVKYEKDGNGTLGEVTGVTWTAPVPGVLNVDSTGKITAAGASVTATVTAEVGSYTFTFYAYISK